jgi:predicted dehydrogenase
MWSADKGADTWLFKKASASFGSMADLGIHKIDLMRYLIGDRVTGVYASLATLDKRLPDGRPIEVDDNSVELLRFAGGTQGIVTTSWTHYGEEDNSTVLYCEKGIMKLYADPVYSLKIVYGDGVKVNYELDRRQTNDDAQQASSGVIDMFIDAVNTGKATPLDAGELIDSMRVVFACVESDAKGTMITL